MPFLSIPKGFEKFLRISFFEVFLSWDLDHEANPKSAYKGLTCLSTSHSRGRKGKNVPGGLKKGGHCAKGEGVKLNGRGGLAGEIGACGLLRPITCLLALWW